MCLRNAVLFDFDLILVESAYSARAWGDYALAAMGHQQQPDGAIDPIVGVTLPETHTQLTGRTDQAERGRYAGLFVERADQVLAELTTFSVGTVPTFI